MTEQSAIITVDNVTKTFKTGAGKIDALKNVDLSVNKGTIFGLLGPNGAGKTTLIKILLGALKATNGTGAIDGISIRNSESRKKIGYLPENHQFPSYQTGLQMLYYFGGLAGLSKSDIRQKSDRLLELVGMDRWAKTKISQYSKGMKQRLGLAQSILNDPDLIFLDEPTDGVDPLGRKEIRDILKNLQTQGTTIFLNSHLLSEVETTCDQVAVLNRGEVIKVGPAVGLISTRPTYTVTLAEIDNVVIDKVKEKMPDAVFDRNTINLVIEDDKKINILIDLLRDNNVDILSVIPQKLSLEESFIKLIKGQENNV